MPSWSLVVLLTMAGCTAPEPLNFGTGGTSGAAGLNGAGGESTGGRDGGGPVAGSRGTAGSAGGGPDPASGHPGPLAGGGGMADGGGPRVTGGFPPVDDLTEEGGYLVRQEVVLLGDNDEYRVFYPFPLLRDGVRHPVLSWSSGTSGAPMDYPLVPHLSSHGFVVIASNMAVVTGAELRTGLSWMVAQDSDPASPFYNTLDVDRLAAVGIAGGAFPTYQLVAELAEDTLGQPAARAALTTLVVISGGSPSESLRARYMPLIHTPTAYFCTDDVASEDSCWGDFQVIESPAFFAVMDGSEFRNLSASTEQSDPEVIERLNEAATGWLRWQLMADSAWQPLFLGPGQLCDDPGRFRVCASRQLSP